VSPLSTGNHPGLAARHVTTLAPDQTLSLSLDSTNERIPMTNNVDHDPAPLRAWEPPPTSRTPAAQAHRSRRRAALRFASLEVRPAAWSAALSEADRLDELREDLAAACDGPTLALLRAALKGAL
jgi:hypothetical protein